MSVIEDFLGGIFHNTSHAWLEAFIRARRYKSISRFVIYRLVEDALDSWDLPRGLVPGLSWDLIRAIPKIKWGIANKKVPKESRIRFLRRVLEDLTSRTYYRYLRLRAKPKVVESAMEQELADYDSELPLQDMAREGLSFEPVYLCHTEEEDILTDELLPLDLDRFTEIEVYAIKTKFIRKSLVDRDYVRSFVMELLFIIKKELEEILKA